MLSFSASPPLEPPTSPLVSFFERGGRVASTSVYARLARLRTSWSPATSSKGLRKGSYFVVRGLIPARLLYPCKLFWRGKLYSCPNSSPIKLFSRYSGVAITELFGRCSYKMEIKPITNQKSQIRTDLLTRPRLLPVYHDTATHKTCMPACMILAAPACARKSSSKLALATSHDHSRGPPPRLVPPPLLAVG